MRRHSMLVLSFLAFPLLAAQRDPGTAFAVAIERHDAGAVKELLQSNSAETLIDYGEHKITPLIKAAWEGDAEIVGLLLAAGAKVNAKATDTGETALMNAVSRGNPEIIKMLLEAHADVSVRNGFDFTPLTSAVAAGKEDLAAMLLDAGAKVDDSTSGLTPLMFAASAGNVDMIRFLAKRGANVNKGAKTGEQTALISAIMSGQAEAVKALIALEADVNAKMKDGLTPLKAAMKGDQDDVVKLLAAAGAKQ